MASLMLRVLTHPNHLLEPGEDIHIAARPSAAHLLRAWFTHPDPASGRVTVKRWCEQRRHSWKTLRLSHPVRG